MNQDSRQDKGGPSQDDPGLLREIGGDLARGAGVSLRWFLGGALIGGALVGGAGAWFFGWPGFLYGGIAGALICGVGAWFFYVSNS